MSRVSQEKEIDPSGSILPNNRGVFLTTPHAKEVYDGCTKVIINSKLFKNTINQLFYIVDNEYAYGIVQMEVPYKIGLEEFKRLSVEHNVTEEERLMKWPSKKVLFAYPFKVVEMLDKPKRINIHTDTEFVKVFEFIQEQEMACKKKKYSMEDFSLLDDFKDMRLIKDFISIVGSYAEKPKDRVPKDIDILVRMKEPTEYLKRAVEVRIIKSLGWDNDLADKVHFIWGEAEGPHDTHIPMYDLILQRLRPFKRVEMLDNEVQELSLGFKPMKPSKKFFEMNDLLNFMFSHGNAYAVEKKFNGFRGILVKRGNSYKVYSEQGKDISRHFKTVLSQAKDLSAKDYEIDGELVLEGGGRSQLAKFVTGKADLDDSKITFEAFDILKSDGDVSSKPWHERKSLLHGLNFTKNIREVRSIVVKTPGQARKAVDMMRNLPKSEGAMVKKWDGRYKKGGESADWIKFRNKDDLDVMVLGKKQAGEGTVYQIGIHVKGSKDKFKEKFVVDTVHGPVLVLGNTFVTKKDFKKDSHIKISVEEVWRHEFSDKKIRYSIHKPTVIGPVKGSSTWKDLDKLAVAKGELVIENKDVVLENVVKKRGDEYCIVKEDTGNVIKVAGGRRLCFPSKAKADSVLKAIKARQAQKMEQELAEERESLQPKALRFFKSWSSDMAYVMGYITSDAHVYEEKNRIEMSSEDKQLLSMLKSKLGLKDEKIRPVEGYYVLRFVDGKVVQQLKKLGFTHLKENRTTYKRVPAGFINDYIRGVMDGDGTLDSERDKLQIDTSNIGLANWMFKKLKAIGGDGVKMYTHGNNVRKVAVLQNTKKVLDWIYSGGKMYLKRKKSTAKKIKNQDTTESTPGVSDVQGKIIKKKKPIESRNMSDEMIQLEVFEPEAKSTRELLKMLQKEGEIYNKVKSGKIGGSLEKPLLKGRIIYTELKRRKVKVILPPEFKEFINIVISGETGITKKNQKERDDFGETREEATDAFWNSNWQNMFPKDGKGRFTYHHHWRGLTEEETKMSDEQLLNTNNSLHGDFRFEVDGSTLWGFTAFIGTAASNKEKGGDKLVWESKHKDSPSKVRGGFKLAMPYSWLNVGKGDGTISKPGGVGATAHNYAKFFIYDSGTYEMGVARLHSREVFLKGDKLKGRFLFQYAPLKEGRNWLIDFPKDQRPIADKKDIEKVKSELKSKKQKWLLWAKPGMKPKKIQIK